MLIDVLTRFCEDTGKDLVQQRSEINRTAQQAAKELYEELACNRMLREVSCLVPRNKIVALPTYIGPLIAMRQHTSEVIVPLHSMTPRYASNTLTYKWKNWRDLGEGPLHTYPTAIDTISFEAPSVTDAAVIKVTGQTDVANLEEATVNMTASPSSTTKLFNPAGLKSIASLSDRTCDITVKDSDGNEIAVLYNNEKKTRYRMVDVSELFWGNDSSDGSTIIDILYKAPLPILRLDTDSLPVGDDYDEAWYYRMMAIFYKDKGAERREDANRALAQSRISAQNIRDGQERGQIKKLEFGRNKYMSRAYYCGAYRYGAGTFQDEPYSEY